MDPQIHLLTSFSVDWPTLKATINKVFSDRPDNTLAGYRAPLSEAAEYLLYLAWLSDISINNPQSVLHNCPPNLMEHIHYTFMIGCDEEVASEFSIGTSLHLTVSHADSIVLIIASGSLATWHSTLTLNLTKKKLSYNFSVLLNKLLIAFDKLGLSRAFAKYNRLPKRDGTFLLEYKK